MEPEPATDNERQSFSKALGIDLLEVLGRVKVREGFTEQGLKG